MKQLTKLEVLEEIYNEIFRLSVRSEVDIAFIESIQISKADVISAQESIKLDQTREQKKQLIEQNKTMKRIIRTLMQEESKNTVIS